jgi:hypothetical protein
VDQKNKTKTIDTKLSKSFKKLYDKKIEDLERARVKAAVEEGSSASQKSNKKKKSSVCSVLER